MHKNTPNYNSNVHFKPPWLRGPGLYFQYSKSYFKDSVLLKEIIYFSGPLLIMPQIYYAKEKCKKVKKKLL